MKYMGSKNRYAKEILNIILRYRKPEQYYVEPFCGGCNIIDKVKPPTIANDINEYLVEMWKALQSGWIPPKFVSEKVYKDIQNNKEKYPKYLVGYVGFNISFAGKFFGGYARDSQNKRNYSYEAYKNIASQIPFIKDIIFSNKQYYELSIPYNSIIYCDPPYQNTTKYKNVINYEHFWNWCRKKTLEGHNVFVSEYNAPEDFICIWNKKVNSSLDLDTGSKQNTEKLFVYSINNNYTKAKSLFDF